MGEADATNILLKTFYFAGQFRHHRSLSRSSGVQNIQNSLYEVQRK